MKTRSGRKGRRSIFAALALLAVYIFAVKVLDVDLSHIKRFFAGEGDLLILVNPWNEIPDGYSPELYTLSDGRQVDKRCYNNLEKMLSDCRASGNSPYICSAYRTWETQQELFDDKIARLESAGYTAENAKTEASRVVALPGTSEHQLGLALDIIDSVYTALDQGQENTSTQQWLMENSWRYGFILRYPNGSSEITGIIYEPWHYRYVGVDTAREIHEQGVTLEEYLLGRSHLAKNTFLTR